MTERAWPSRRTRRALRLAFWRHRRGIRGLLVGVTVLCSLQVVAGRVPQVERSSAPARVQDVDGATGRTQPAAADGLVTTIVRFADPGTALLVTAGSVVDVLATPPVPFGDGTGAAAAAGVTPLAEVVASGVRVVRVPGEASPAGTEGALLVLAVTPTTARLLAAAASQRLSLVVRPGATAP